MACVKVKHKRPPSHTNYNPTIIIQGKVYYYMPALESEDGNVTDFASLYIHDPAMQETVRSHNLYLPKNTSASEKRTCESILQDLLRELAECNPYVRDFTQVCHMPEHNLHEASFVLSEKSGQNKLGLERTQVIVM